MGKTALITGITGQDGSYLTELLLEKDYNIFGLIRRSSTTNLIRISHVVDKITLLEGDLTDQSSLGVAIQTSQPDEVYNLGAQSFVATSWNQPSLTGDVTGLGAVKLLEAVRQFSKNAKFYQASSSEMFGMAEESPQNENTRFHPRSPYGCAKAYAYYIAKNYRESYGMFVCNGILFNHESPRRGIEFVSRKITDGVARIYHGLSKELRLGNLKAKRDWGFAGDYVKSMWQMLQQDKPDDYVIATGESHSVEDFVNLSFKEVGLNWKEYVKVDPRYYRPADIHSLCGDYSKAKITLGWRPELSFNDLVKIMIKTDMEKLK